MSKFIIEPHFRLQEWVAEEKGYFRAEGLDYEFRELIRSTEGQHHNKANQGAFQSIEKGREANVSCACHWTVNVAASNGHAKLYADVYSVAPSGIFVPADSPVRTPADLAGVPISVGFQSGSHYSTIQALEQYMAPGEINLTFEDGMLFHRMEQLIEGKSPAAALFNGPYYLAEQLGFRKVIDTTFMIAAMIKGDRGAGRRQAILPRLAPGAARYRSAAGTLHALLQERISGAFPRRHGYAPLGAGRADRVRDLFEGSVRAVVRLDRGARDLCRRANGIGRIRPVHHLVRGEVDRPQVATATTPRRSHPARRSAPPGPAAGSAAT